MLLEVTEKEDNAPNNGDGDDDDDDDDDDEDGLSWSVVQEIPCS